LSKGVEGMRYIDNNLWLDFFLTTVDILFLILQKEKLWKNFFT
jgi:hypothetical protein